MVGCRIEWQGGPWRLWLGRTAVARCLTVCLPWVYDDWLLAKMRGRIMRGDSVVWMMDGQRSFHSAVR